MIFYTTLFIGASIFSFINIFWRNKVFNRMISIILLIGLCLITGTRYFMGGYDIINYSNFFQTTPTLNVLPLRELLIEKGIIGGDIGYLLINSFIKTIGFSFFGFTLIVAIFFYSSIYITFKKYINNFTLFLVFFFYKSFLDVTFVYMRQSIAIALFFLSLKYLDNRKFFKYALIIVIASTVHFSAIILLILIPLKQLKITRKILIIYSVILTLSYIITYYNINIVSYIYPFFDFLKGTANMKLESAAGLNSLYESSKTNILHLVEFLVIDAILIYSFDSIDVTDSKKDTAIKLFLCLLPIFSIFAGQEIFIRMKYYLILSYPLVLEYSFVKFDKVKITVIVLVASVLCYFGMLKFAMQFDGGVMLNYESFLQHDVSIFKGEGE